MVKKQTWEYEDKENYDEKYKADKYYITGYKRGKEYGYKRGKEVSLNKKDKNSEYYLSRGEVYKLYYDIFKNKNKLILNQFNFQFNKYYFYSKNKCCLC